jgi:Ran GTPase-activating protein (RanGAP) involved in mRNA processing and transport
MKARNSFLALQSIEKLTKNELGVEGWTLLAAQILNVKKLKELRLADCRITDKGIIALIHSVD